MTHDLEALAERLKHGAGLDTQWDAAAALLWAAQEIERKDRALPRWRSIVEDGPPLPEVLVLCWDGSGTFVDWFGSKNDAGRGVTHWIPYPMPPGAKSAMHDGTRAALAKDSHE